MSFAGSVLNFGINCEMTNPKNSDEKRRSL